MDEDEDEYDAERALPWDHPAVTHLRGLPPDARRVGLDRNTQEGALLAFSGALDRRRPAHRLTAWILLVVFALPAVMAALHLSTDLVQWIMHWE